MKARLLLFALFFSATRLFSQFTPTNIIVLQAGDGSAALGSTATPIFLREFTPSGSAGITYTVPVNSNTMTMSGSATSEGAMTLSSDGQFLIFPGYNSPVGTTGVASTTTVTPRVIGAVNAATSISRVFCSSFFSGNNIRGACSDGQGNFWAAGGNSGTCYFGTNSATAAVQTSITNTKYVNIYNNGLYISTGSGTPGIYKIGTGLPVTSGQTASLVINSSTVGTSASPIAFCFNPSMTICYVADDRATASNGGIQKWVYSAGTWTLAYIISSGSTSGARGVIADFSGSNPLIYGTSAETSANRIFKINDIGSSATATTIATATTNSIFRGITFAPTSCTSASITAVSSNTSVCNNQSVALSVTALGTSPLSYTWAGPGTLNSYSISNPVLTNPATGDYTVSVGNACGTSSAAITITSNASPSLVVNPATVCPGFSAILSVTGANTYTWDNSSTNSTISVSPTVSTVYTISGTSAAGCSGSNTVSVMVNNLPTVTVNSATICAGGTATLSANGALSYTWNTLSNNASITASPSLTATYTVSGADGNGCVNSATTSILVTSSPTVSINSASICAGQTGTLTASGALSYTWNTSATSSVITVNPSGTTVYSVTGDAGGCLASGTGTLTVISLPTVSVNQATLCLGATTILTASGAATYSWSTGSTSSSISITPGITSAYTVDGSLNGCTNSSSTTVIVNPLPTVSANSATICNGSTATLSASGAGSYTWNTTSNAISISVTPTLTTTYTISGTSTQGCINSATTQVVVNSLPLITINSATVCAGTPATLSGSGASTYTWNTGSNAVSISPSPSATTTYSLSGTSVLGCVGTNTTSVLVNPAPVITVNSSTICAGASATLIASGATSYTWNTSAGTPSIVVNPTISSTYTVNGSSALGCTGNTSTSVFVNSLPVISINAATICAGSAATLTAGGAATYSWNTGSNASAISVSPGSNTSYTINGSSAQGCISSATTQVVVNSLPLISVNSATICAGSSASLIASGASTYSWNTGSNAAAISVSPGSNTSYTINGSSALGCNSTATTQVVVNSLPVITLNSATICAGATATLSASGATSYTWNTSSNSSAISVSPSSTSVYTLSGTSALGCTGINTATVLVNPIPSITVSSGSVCAGNSVSLSAGGASTYSWSTGSTVSSITVSPGVTTVYTVNGTSSGCTGVNTVTAFINTLPVIVAAPISICSGGTATLSASGASSYTWDTGSNSPFIVVTPTTNSNYTISGTSAFGCVNSTTTSVSITASPTITANSVSVCAGDQATLIASGVATYTWSNGANTSSITISPTATAVYTVSGNGSGCSAIATSTLAVTLNTLPALSVTSATICSGNSATLSASGATSYTWSNSGGGSSISPSPSVTSNYTVSGTSPAGCVNSAVATVSVNASPSLSVNSASLCAGASATLIASGASSYSWNTGATTSSIVVTPSVNTNYLVTGSVSGCSGSNTSSVTVNNLPTVTATSSSICIGSQATLTAGGAVSYTWTGFGNTTSITVNPVSNTNYTLSGSSAQGCTNSAVATVTVNALPVLSVTSATVCAGSTATLLASGASTYSWSNSSTSASINPSPSVTTIYSVTATSSAGCVKSGTTQVNVNPNPTVSVNSSTICSGASATLSASGAASYSWSSGASVSSVVIFPTLTTVYTVTGTSTGCTGLNTSTVTVNSLPSINVNSLSICSGGTATLIASGAASYTWNTTSTNSSITANPAITTVYTVSGTSTLGCVNTSTTTVIVTNSPAISVNSSTICAGNSATLTASGVASYTWNTGATTPSIVVSPATNTTYSITGNASGCPLTASTTASVSVNALPTLSVNSLAICAGASATLTASGATSFTWNASTFSNSLVVSPATTTTYSVTGTLNNCSSIASAIVSVNPLPVVSVNSPTSICAGTTFTLNASGANTYLWNTGAGTSSLAVSPSSTTNYSVTGTSAQGCTNIAVSTISVNTLPTVSLSLSNSVVCLNDRPLNLSGIPAGGNYSGAAVSGNTFNPLVAGAGTYTLSYSFTDANLCSASDSKVITVSACTGLNLPGTSGGLTVYPNPANNHVTIENPDFNGSYRVELFTLNGNLLMETTSNEATHTADLSRFANGLYILRISGNTGVINFRLIKE